MPLTSSEAGASESRQLRLFESRSGIGKILTKHTITPETKNSILVTKPFRSEPKIPLRRRGYSGYVRLRTAESQLRELHLQKLKFGDATIAVGGFS